MKQIVIFVFFFCFASYSQTLSEKWNDTYGRYEYFNGNGQMVGYKVYNAYTQSWDYFDNSVNSRQRQPLTYQAPIATYDFQLLNQALAYKQNAMDNGVDKVQNTINQINSHIFQLRVPSEIQYKINERFNNEYIQHLNNSNYDYSNISTVNQLVNYLIKGANKIIKEETE